jgi:hypothetical protein
MATVAKSGSIWRSQYFRFMQSVLAARCRCIARCPGLDYLSRIAGLPPCLIGMEACSGSHEWAQRSRDPWYRPTCLVPAPKISTLGGCEYPTASSSHGKHLLVSRYNRGVSLTA